MAEKDRYGRRRTLVWMLLLVWLALPYLGGFGPVEVILWLGLLSGWFWLLLVWSKRPSTHPLQTSVKN